MSLLATDVEKVDAATSRRRRGGEGAKARATVTRLRGGRRGRRGGRRGQGWCGAGLRLRARCPAAELALVGRRGALARVERPGWPLCARTIIAPSAPGGTFACKKVKPSDTRHAVCASFVP